MKQNTKFKRILEVLAVAAFFSAFILSLSRPIGDPDVFWHLKTGEWIWQNKTLPDEDPFSFTVAPSEYAASARTSFILKQYWLGQLIMFGFYQIGGFYGLIVFRCLIYAGIGLILYYWMRKEGINRLTALIFLMPSAYLSNCFLGERPNNLSFLFAVIVVYLLENPPIPPLLKGGKGGLLKLIALPLVMLLWANMHGGFLLGDAIIFLYIFSGGLKFFYMKIKHRPQSAFQTSDYGLNTFFIVCLSSIFISFINPNSYRVIPTLLELEGTYYSASIMEMASPLKFAGNVKYQLLILIGSIGLFFLLKIRQMKFNLILLITFLVVLALTRLRYIPFLLYISTPFIACLWMNSFDLLTRKLERFHALFWVVLAFAIFLISSNIKGTVLKLPSHITFYPDASVEFIKKEKPEGRIFNEYEWGGYLIWKLYPEYRVFIDGRSLVQSTFSTYKTALSGSVKSINGVPEWKAILNSHGVNAVIVSGISVSGENFPRLLRRLVDDKDWELVFIDQRALIFIKDTDNNREIIRKYSKPKVLAYGKALELAEFYRTTRPDDWKVYTTLGEINLYLGSPKIALLNFEYAFRINPSLQSTSFGNLIEKLRAGRDYSGLLDEIFR